MKILIWTKNWLGDVLFQIPAIETVRREYPTAEIVCVSPARCHDILAAHPAVTRVIAFDEKKEHRSPAAKINFLLQLKREKFDRAYLLHRSRTRALLLWLAGIKERTGYAKGRKGFLTQAVPEPRGNLHHVDYFLNLLQQAGLPCEENARYHFYYSEKASRTAEKLLEKNQLTERSFIAFHLGANWEPKRWPPVYFAKLADLIHDRWKLPIVITGSANDAALVQVMSANVKKARILSFVSQINLQELGAIYEKCLFLVTGDSGPMHIGSGVGAPVVALFGPTDPNLTGPRGTGEKIVLQYVPEGLSVPFYGKEFPKGGWLSHIQPEEVIRAVEEKNWIELKDRRPKTEDRKKILPPSPVTGPPSSNGKNILLITLTNIGDVILITPVIRTLAAKFPDAKITAVTGPRSAEILSKSRLIHRLVIYDKHASLFEKWKFLRALQKETYDCVVDLKHTAIPYLVRARKRSPLFRFSKEVSLRKRHLELIKRMGLETSPVPPFDFFHSQDDAGLLEKTHKQGMREEKNWILVAPIAASGLKTWRFEGFQKVIERLLADFEQPIVLAGSSRERQLLEPLTRINPLRIFNLAGETTLPELAALITRSALVVANDSSILHLTRELERPVVGIFGPTPPERIGQEDALFKIVREPVPCSPCDKPVCRFERQSCFEDLQPEKVFQACKEMLDKKNLAGVPQ